MDVMEPLVNVGFVTRGFVGSNAVNDNTDQIRGSIVVSISTCHAEDPGSIPGRGGVNTASLVVEQTQRSALDLQRQAGFPPGVFTIMLRILGYPVYICP